jgi:signal transduction histidine kinase
VAETSFNLPLFLKAEKAGTCLQTIDRTARRQQLVLAEELLRYAKDYSKRDEGLHTEETRLASEMHELVVQQLSMGI